MELKLIAAVIACTYIFYRVLRGALTTHPEKIEPLKSYVDPIRVTRRKCPYCGYDESCDYCTEPGLR